MALKNSNALTNFKWNIDPAISTATAYQFIKYVLYIQLIAMYIYKLLNCITVPAQSGSYWIANIHMR